MKNQIIEHKNIRKPDDKGTFQTYLHTLKQFPLIAN